MEKVSKLLLKKKKLGLRAGRGARGPGHQNPGLPKNGPNRDRTIFGRPVPVRTVLPLLFTIQNVLTHFPF